MNFDTHLIRMYNSPTLHELASCDVGIVPTEWQKQQFPKEYREKLNIIFDGIDRKFFRENPKIHQKKDEELVINNRETQEQFKLKGNEEIITYTTRGMEPVRGFLNLGERQSRLSKQINEEESFTGKDRVAYSYGSPASNGSWKNYLLEKVDKDIRDRLLFCGLLNYDDYRNLLWRSDIAISQGRMSLVGACSAAACGCNTAYKLK